MSLFDLVSSLCRRRASGQGCRPSSEAHHQGHCRGWQGQYRSNRQHRRRTDGWAFHAVHEPGKDLLPLRRVPTHVGLVGRELFGGELLGRPHGAGFQACNRPIFEQSPFTFALEHSRPAGTGTISRRFTFHEHCQLFAGLDIQFNESPVQMTFDGAQ